MTDAHGHTEPRVYTPPARTLDETTSLGFSVIAFARDILGIELLPWQQWLLIHALELTPAGRLRYRYVLVLVARQNGKTLVSVVLALWALFVRGVQLIVGTAQTLDIAEEVWGMVVEMAEASDDLKPLIKSVTRVNGKKSISLISGGRYKVAPASRRGGRGLSADLILLDELREQTTWDAWAAVTKTMLARPDAMVWAMSNAGDGTSVVLDRLRKIGHASIGDPDGICGDDFDAGDLADASVGIFEWSAPPDEDIMSLDGLLAANPSCGYTIELGSLLSARATDPPVVFLTECLCQWYKAAAKSPFPSDAWEACSDAASLIDDYTDIAFGIDVSDDRRYTALAVCGRRADGAAHVEVIEYRTGISWIVEWIRRHLVADFGHVRIAVQGRGCPASSTVDLLRTIDGVEVVEVVGRDVAATCGRFYDSVMASIAPPGDETLRVYHRPQPVLDMAAATAQTKAMGDGAWAWDRSKSTEDISPLVACTLAFGIQTAADPVDAGTMKKRYRSALDGDDRTIALVTV